MTTNLPGALKFSPFHDYWAARMLTNAWSPECGMSLPNEIFGRVEEVAAFGSAAAFADISNRCVTAIAGPDTASFLSALTGETEDVFASGASRSVVWCDLDGFARGSGHVAMRGQDNAILIAQTSDRTWFQDLATAFEVELSQSGAAGLRLAGPKTGQVLQACSAVPGSPCEMVFPGLGSALAIPVKPDAIDLWVEPDNAHALAWTLDRAGALPAGMTALNAWRIANGLLSANQDWRPAHHCTSQSELRLKDQLTQGSYALVAWHSQPPAEVQGAVPWPPLGQWVAVLWLPPQPGRAQLAPAGGVILGSAATD
jgi:glycine cleavage system aminomethyltransferase T